MSKFIIKTLDNDFIGTIMFVMAVVVEMVIAFIAPNSKWAENAYCGWMR